MNPDNNKRQVCEGCGYPLVTCLCPWVMPISPPVNIIILQHPKEAKHAKNTVKLLALGLKHLTVIRGEVPSDWTRLAQDVTHQPQDYCVIYPHGKSQPLESIDTEEHKTEFFPPKQNVILIDASWRKALKIWHLNPWLQKCHSWHFNHPPENQYQIRHTTQKHSLSTLESVAYILEHTQGIDCSGLITLLSMMQQKCFLESRPAK